MAAAAAASISDTLCLVARSQLLRLLAERRLPREDLTITGATGLAETKS
jgi:hypothetical protein